MTPDDLQDACRLEIEQLHRFFQQWFSGHLEHDEQAFARVSAVLAEGFELISPDGRRASRATLLQQLHAAHGSGQGPSRIWVEAYQGVTLGPDLLLATYEEWQDIGASRRGRLSTALFRTRAETPNAVEWMHVHEVWLPTPNVLPGPDTDPDSGPS